jgi:[ribosomal protein S5]-alanine N-acetyltransferase
MDLDALTELNGTPEVRRALRLPDPAGRPASAARDDAWASMALWLGQWVLRGTGQWALEEKASGAFVGRAGIHHPGREGWPGFEVGWALHPRHWGMGYATEAGARSLAYAFDELALERVCSVILPDNERSQAVAGRLGLRLSEERTLPHYPDEPHGIWWITVEEWRSR